MRRTILVVGVVVLALAMVTPPAAALPPSNDNFADAEVISSLPYTSAMVDTSEATVETGEPRPTCLWASTADRTIWYAFTPSMAGSIYAAIDNPNVALAVYTGSQLSSLTEIGCRAYSVPFVFQAEAGTTYYLQIAPVFGQTGESVRLSLDVPPDPVAAFSYSPFDPSIFDVVQFVDGSYDPAGVGFQSWAWDFGDGTTSSEWGPSHQYAKDGDYTIKLTVTTLDGRVASTSQTVQVKTHDVAIAKFTAPTSAKAGQTRQISVGVGNLRYVETVRAELYRSVPGGFALIGSSEGLVPVRPANRTTAFGFTYTFTKADASAGKVTFRAVAVIVGARDALPADNEAIALPTKVAP